VVVTIVGPLLTLFLLPPPAACLSLIAVVRVVRTRRYALDLLIIPFSLLVVPSFHAFFDITWSLYGD
jgi:hypothetical protein